MWPNVVAKRICAKLLNGGKIFFFMQTILTRWILLSCWACFWMLVSLYKAFMPCLYGCFVSKKEKQLAITVIALEIIICIHRVSCPKASIYSFVGTPRLGLCHQERPRESPQVKCKAVRAAMSNHIIISSFLIPRLWIYWGHEKGIPVFCGWKSQRNHLLQHSQEMEAPAVWVSHAYMLLLNWDCRTGTCNIFEKRSYVLFIH